MRLEMQCSENKKKEPPFGGSLICIISYQGGDECGDY